MSVSAASPQALSTAATATPAWKNPSCWVSPGAKGTRISTRPGSTRSSTAWKVLIRPCCAKLPRTRRSKFGSGGCGRAGTGWRVRRDELVRSAAAPRAGRGDHRSVYSLVGASLLGFDLVRRRGGAASARVLRWALGVRRDDVPVLDALHGETVARDAVWLRLSATVGGGADLLTVLARTP